MGISGAVTVWSGNYYPDAGEMTAWSEVVGRIPAAAENPAASVGDRMAAIFGGQVPEGAGSARDPLAVDNANRDRSGRRSRSRLRRYSAANRLDRLIVLTYAEPQHDLRRVKQDVRVFVKRRLRGLIGPDAAYAVTFETHKSGAWHVNILVPSYIRHARLARAWGRGYVWIHKFQAKRGGSGRDAARLAARYVAKYAGKEVEGMAAGQHAYEVAQGFQPAVVRLYGSSPESVAALVDEGVPAYAWHSIGEPSFTGPPVAFFSWD